MPDRIVRAKWERFFSAKNRIETNFVAEHPNFPAHDHEFIEVQLIVGGTCLQRSSLGEARPVTGDVFLFRPGAWHAFEQVHGLDLYNCCFDSSLLSRELAWMIDVPSLGSLLWSIPLSPKQQGMVSLHLPPREVKRCRKLLDALRRLARADAAVAFADQLGLLLQFLSLLARHVPAEQVRQTSDRPHSSIAAALRLIDEHPADEWTLSLLAERVHIEPTYFVRLFHKSVGVPPMAYLTGRRAELAAGLLRRTHLPVGEVGKLVGWPDPNHFSRRFREKLGLSPSRYRQRFAAAEKRQGAASATGGRIRKRGRNGADTA
jgi:AraC family L-rhamnose operon transcriptional activator RhaR